MTRFIKLEVETKLGLSKRLDPIFMAALDSCRRLARKHCRLAEMSCNGEGWIRGQRYYCGTIDEWARREYGSQVKSAYTDPSQPERTIFDIESDKIEAKIKSLWESVGGNVEFRGDPRGATVMLSYEGKDMTALIWE